MTGHDTSGKSVFVSDESVAPVEPILTPAASFHRLWGGDTTPHFPDDGVQPAHRTYFPPIGGFRFGMFTVAPDGTEPPVDVDVTAGLADMEANLPGLMSYLDRTDPGMHATDTIDFEVVLDGTVVLELDDGATVTLRPGDTVVQNGTRHRWSNPGDTPARVACFFCGAEHTGLQ